MENNRFDDLARSLGTRRNRRSVVTSLGSAALGAAGILGLSRSAGAAGAQKVGVCHVTGNGSYQYITVAQSAVSAHLAHGDFVSDGNGGCEADTCPGTTCPDYDTPSGDCYRLSNGSPGNANCWYPTGVLLGFTADQATCEDFGGCASGGCYDWRTSSC